MAKRSLAEKDSLEEFLIGPKVQDLERTMWVAGKMLESSGMISGADYEKTTIGKRRRMNGKPSALRRPVSLTVGHRPDFMISGDVYRTHIREFQESLKGPFQPQEAEGLARLYSTFSAWGEFLFRALLTSSTYERSIDRLVAMSELLTDRSDFTEHFSKRLESTRMEGLMKTIDDSALLQINGLRAGMTMVRAGLQSEGVDPITDDTVLACNAALEAFVTEEGPKYVHTTDYLNLTTERGVTTFGYAVPEWLYVLGVPLPAQKIEPLMGEDWLDLIGPCDWNPSLDLTL